MVGNLQAFRKLEFQVPTNPRLCRVLHEIEQCERNIIMKVEEDCNNRVRLVKRRSGTIKKAEETNQPLLWIISGARYSGVPHNVQVLDTTT